MTDDADVKLLEATAATEIDRMQRIAKLGNRGTAGPESHPGVVDVTHPPSPRWDHGWWTQAIRKPAHVGRVGGPISAFSLVVHTTDMLPEEWAALVHAWTERSGDGACAHFLIGRDDHDGVIQFVPTLRNGNHAGGPTHGVYVDGTGRTWHPNTAAIGVELHCAGGVRRIAGQWRLVEGGKAHGAPLPDADVIPDPHHADRGWHKITDYQYERLAALRADLELVMAPMPAGTVARSTHEAPAAWAKPASARCVGHTDLDAYARSDPWPPAYENGALA